jgi:hypothetical protein
LSLAKLALPAMILLAVGGCNRTGEIMEGGISAVRSPCPRVGVPAGTGDMTMFDPPSSREADAIDITATMTNVVGTCNDSGPEIVTTVTFDVLVRRAKAGPARDVSLPYFITLVRGGSSVVAKRVGRVTVHFDEGQTRAQTSGQASTGVGREAATLPEDVRQTLNKKRRAGQEAAAMDPLSDPAVRSAVLSATFEALVGFQLTEDQLKYNVTR